MTFAITTVSLWASRTNSTLVFVSKVDGVLLLLGLPCGPKKTVKISIVTEDLSGELDFFGRREALLMYIQGGDVGLCLCRR